MAKNKIARKAEKKSDTKPTIALNRRARHDFALEDRFEAGLVLQGWEVKSLRSGKGRIAEAYVLLKDGEAWLLGAHIDPLASASSHVHTDPTRTRKLLLNAQELSRLVGATERQGYTIIPTALYWKNGLAKLEVALAKGKQKKDKRDDVKKRDWQREKQRTLKHSV
ncbi:MAG: SsrA-binding protein SmpB [Salinisphaeraceae bacterium]|nr:SsrA-binding protein SmpB [Salinisphaeraceae bacterium]